MESESRKRAKRHQIQKIILETIKVAGVLSVGIVAPNVVGAMAKLSLIPHPRQRELIRRSVDRMYAQGLLRHDGGKLKLTAKGVSQLRSLELRTFSRKPFRWDKKWRVLIFDIPEERRVLRNQVRRTLFANGFLRVQRSVWIYPYDCEDWVGLWKADLKLGKELLYLIVDTIEGDSVLKRSFDL